MADYCSLVMDWLIDLAGESGVEVIVDPTTKDWYFPNYPLIHVFLPHRQQSRRVMRWRLRCRSYNDGTVLFGRMAGLNAAAELEQSG